MINKTYKTKNRKLILNFWLIGCIILSTLFLSVGYADITSTNLDINLNLSTTAYKDIFISDVQYTSSNGADIANSKIINYTGTMLHSNIYLSTSDKSSSITYTVTITNNSDTIKQFIGVNYSDSEEFYSNKDIIYRINGMVENEVFEIGETKTCEITYYYDNITTIVDNNLYSYLSFNFGEYEESDPNDIIIPSGGDSYTFNGVSPGNPINFQNITNIDFNIKNNSGNTITGFKVDVTYTTSTGAKHSANITLNGEDNSVLGTKTVQFAGKQTNAIATATFSNISIGNGEKVHVKFAKGTGTNGQVSISNVKITPIF